MTAAPRVLGIAGYSGSGKTTPITGLLPRLKALGLAVGVLDPSHALDLLHGGAQREAGRAFFLTLLPLCGYTVAP